MRRRRDPVEPAADWDVEFASNRAAKGWAELKTQFPKPLRQAYDAISSTRDAGRGPGGSGP